MMPVAKICFQNNLAKLMEAHKLTPYRVAKDIGRPSTTIARYLSKNDAQALPSEAVLRDLCHYFGLKREEMIYAEIDPSKVTLTKIGEGTDTALDKYKKKHECPLYTVTDCLRMAQGEKVEARTQLSRPTVLQRPLDSTMFAYQVLGNGFAPDIRHGDITFCYRYQKGMTLREGTVLLAAIQPKDYQEPVLTFGYLTFGAFGEKAIKYPFEGKERRQDLPDENIIGVVAVNTTEYV